MRQSTLHDLMYTFLNPSLTQEKHQQVLEVLSVLVITQDQYMKDYDLWRQVFATSWWHPQINIMSSFCKTFGVMPLEYVEDSLLDNPEYMKDLLDANFMTIQRASPRLLSDYAFLSQQIVRSPFLPVAPQILMLFDWFNNKKIQTLYLNILCEQLHVQKGSLTFDEIGESVFAPRLAPASMQQIQTQTQIAWRILQAQLQKEQLAGLLQIQQVQSDSNPRRL